MRDKILFFLIAAATALPLNAQENIAINLNVGNFGYGGFFPLKDDYNSELIMTVLNIGLEHKKTNLGFEFSPFSVFYWIGKTGKDACLAVYSFANLYAYWNIINFDFWSGSVIYFGPFASINYMFVAENVHWDRFVFSGGLRVGFRENIGRLNYNIFSIEMGYRAISGTSKYFIGAKVDIPIFLLVLFAE